MSSNTQELSRNESQYIKATTVEEEIQLDLLDEGMSVNNSIKPEKAPCATKVKLAKANTEIIELQSQVEELEYENLGMKIFMAEVGVYEAWSDNVASYIKKGG